MEVYDSFTSLFEYKIKQFIKENPDWIRLDGAKSGGNREIFCKFKYNNKIWKINSDTHIEKLKIIYNSLITGKDPFIENYTKKNNLLTLELKGNTGFKHLYIYLSK